MQLKDRITVAVKDQFRALERIAETDPHLDRKSEILCALCPGYVERDIRPSFLTLSRL